MENSTPLSRVEDILQSTIDSTEYDKPPQSRVEKLLIDLKEVIEDGGDTSAYHPAGSVDSVAELPAPSADYLGYVYDITQAFTTTSDFKEGAGKSYPAGSNIAIVDVGTPESPSYKYDVLSGFIDTSNFVEKEEGKGLSTNDYTDAEKTKLASLENYDDTEIRSELTAKANDADLAAVAKSGAYSDLSGTPTIPSKTSDLTNDSDFVDETALNTALALKTDLSVIAEPYDSTKAYNAGDIFEYNGELFQVTLDTANINPATYYDVNKITVCNSFKSIWAGTSDQLSTAFIPENSFAFTTDDNETFFINSIFLTEPYFTKSDAKWHASICRTSKNNNMVQYGVILAKNDLTGITNIDDANNLLKLQKIDGTYQVTYPNSTMNVKTGNDHRKFFAMIFSKGTSSIAYLRAYSIFNLGTDTETVMYTPCKLLSWEET